MIVNSGNLVVNIASIDKYVKQELIGEGSYGKVYKVSNP